MVTGALVIVQERVSGIRVLLDIVIHAWLREPWLIPSGSWITTTPGHGPSPGGVPSSEPRQGNWPGGSGHQESTT